MMNTYRMTIAYKGITQTDLHYSDIQGISLARAEMAVLDELNKKKFISLQEGHVIPTSAIMYVQIVEKPEPFDLEKYHDTIYPKKTPM